LGDEGLYSQDRGVIAWIPAEMIPDIPGEWIEDER
jgi:hypothetical protein